MEVNTGETEELIERTGESMPLGKCIKYLIRGFATVE